MMITMESDRLPEAPSCLVIGPIGDEHAPIDTEPRTRYEEALQVLSKIIEPACVRYGITPVRADRMHRPGEVPEQVLVAIRDYDLVIADRSKANPNVLYELALRHAVGTCVIPITGWGSLTLDVGWIRTTTFLRRFASKLSKLAGQSEDLVGRYRDDISKVDKGVSYLLDRLELEPQLISEAGQFPETLVRLADITKESLAATDSLVQQTAQLATIAAVMRTPATRIANSWRALATLSTPIFDWGSRASKVQGNRGPTAIGSP